MCTGEDPWDKPSAASVMSRRMILLILPEEGMDKGGTELPASAETKVALELLKI